MTGRPSGDERRPLVIVGLPRSGTTWTQRILECDPSLLSLLEPDSEGHRASAITAKRRTGRFPVLQPGDREDEYRRLWSWILAGAPESARLRLAAQLLRGVSQGSRKRFLQGGRSPLMAVTGTLGRLPSRPAPVPAPPSPSGPAGILVKTVHSALSVEWLASEFDIDVVVMVRHPGSILASWIDLDLNDQYVPLQHVPAVRAMAEGWGVPLPGGDHLEQMIWKIGLLSAALEASAARHPEWIVRTHEQMCTDPGVEFRRLYAQLGLDWNERAAAKLASNDRPGSGFDAQRVAADLPGNWRSRLTRTQMTELRRVLEPFPLRTWSPEDLGPTGPG